MSDANGDHRNGDIYYEQTTQSQSDTAAELWWWIQYHEKTKEKIFDYVKSANKTLETKENPISFITGNVWFLKKIYSEVFKEFLSR